MTFSSREARADVDIVNNNGWTLGTDGRVNAFLSVMRGAAIPKNEQNFTGLDDEATPDNKIESTRLRTGFIMSVLGFNLRKTLSEGMTARARVALWMLAASQRNWGDEPAVNAREVYFKIDAPWGGFLAGRAMSLFSRGAILLDYDLEHNYGLGHPCATKISRGSVRSSGFGLLFPGFTRASWRTPELEVCSFRPGFSIGWPGEGLTAGRPCRGSRPSSRSKRRRTSRAFAPP
jgi:hypothetical protein